MDLIINSKLDLVLKVISLKSEAWDFTDMCITVFVNCHSLYSVFFLYFLYKLKWILSVKN
jgi:hypothetical protein